MGGNPPNSRAKMDQKKIFKIVRIFQLKKFFKTHSENSGNAYFLKKKYKNADRSLSSKIARPDA